MQRNVYNYWLMCQHISGHKVTQILEDFRSLPVTNNHWQNEVVAKGMVKKQRMQWTHEGAH